MCPSVHTLAVGRPTATITPLPQYQRGPPAPFQSRGGVAEDWVRRKGTAASRRPQTDLHRIREAQSPEPLFSAFRPSPTPEGAEQGGSATALRLRKERCCGETATARQGLKKKKKTEREAAAAA